ncbi:HAD family hydrolase, partial [Ellagibacter isourolithinifaciens]|uniref:HAD family hydrolase n=1 Tax=Ellagibacter isourolithinifaciens TaxID=2137581 RepID=UPI003A8F4E33
VSTRMKTKDGCYTREVDGKPVEGAEKLVAIKQWCDAKFGEDNWELAYAYGDHHSDRLMLDAAEHAFAVNPDHPLSRSAKAKNWNVLEW